MGASLPCIGLIFLPIFLRQYSHRFPLQIQAEWVFDPASGEIYSTVFADFGGDVCLTTGWPFLQVYAFDTSAAGETDYTAIILNEAGEAANYVFRNNKKTTLAASIPPHSIQTITFN